MIFTHSILSGYVSLQGSLTIHMPMLIAMIAFVWFPGDIPTKEEFPDAPRFSLSTCPSSGCERWYEYDLYTAPEGVISWFVFAALMHFILSCFHAVAWLNESPVDNKPASYRVWQLFAVLLETLNLCMMLQLFGSSIVSGVIHHSPKATRFQIWLLCEILVTLSTILASTVYLSLRACFNWNKFMVEEDVTQDFMTSSTKTFILPFVMTAIGPWIANSLLIYSVFWFIEDHKLGLLTNIKTNEDSMNAL